jgi:hypothetical protein
LNYKGVRVNRNETPTLATFEDLFSLLLNALAEQQTMKEGNESSVGLIDIKDRLHALRSDLAAIRHRLTIEATTQRYDRQTPRFAI